MVISHEALRCSPKAKRKAKKNYNSILILLSVKKTKEEEEDLASPPLFIGDSSIPFDRSCWGFVFSDRDFALGYKSIGGDFEGRSF